MRRHRPTTFIPGPDGLPQPVCHINVSHVKTTTIRELKHDTTKVLSWVAGGESVEVLRRKVPVAILTPPKRTADVTRPDFTARLKAIYGDGELQTTGTELVSGARGES